MHVFFYCILFLYKIFFMYPNMMLRSRQTLWSALRPGFPLDPENVISIWNLGDLILKKLCNTKGKENGKSLPMEVS